MTLEEIQNEYNALCFQIGQMHFRKHCMEKDIAAGNERLFALNVEAAKLKAKEAQSAAIKPKRGNHGKRKSH